MSRLNGTLLSCFLLCLVVLTTSTPVRAEGMVGSLEFHVGSLDGLEVAGQDVDASPTLGITPAFEYKLGEVVALGGEWMFLWVAAEEADERRLIMSPHLRVRMSFPVYDKVTFDAVLAGGMAIWPEDSDEANSALGATRFGWSLRFSFGGSYAFNETVAVFANLGYLTTTTYGDDVTATYDSMLIGIGMRARF